MSFFAFSENKDGQEFESDVLAFITDTFDITVSNSNFLDERSNDYIFTLSGSYNLNETWRVFGSIDTSEYADIGFGYSFFMADRIYNEITISAGADTNGTTVYTTGLFSATKWKSFIFYTNFEGQYIGYEFDTDPYPLTIEKSEFMFNKLIGSVYEVSSWFSFTVAYGHDKSHYNHWTINDHSFTTTPQETVRDYISLGAIVNLWGVKPNISHRFDLKNSEENYWDISVSFDF
ncbi:hypothetical protein BCU12_06235 [Vibrio sp. 10N.261.55.A7]|nr:hypothetical protein BCU12_06235 [Vibrio sp. 10N.261.55.A7]